MKAYRLHGINNLRYEEVKVPETKKGWYLVKVKAAGICSSDIPRIYTKGTYNYPTIPGHEFSGEIVEADDHSLIGEHVGIFPLIPCNNCSQCKAKHYEMCENYDYIGSRRDGGFAEYVAVPSWNIICLPKNITFEDAAMLEPLSVALHAIKISALKIGDSFAVIGTGMIGMAAAQWAKYRGAKDVYVIGRNNQKRAQVEQMGDIQYIDSSIENMPNVDVVLEAVGTTDSIERSISIVKAGGTLVLMGNPATDIHLGQDTYWKILRKQLTVKGTWNSSYDGCNVSDWTEAIECLEKGKIVVSSMITHRFNQTNLADALEMMYKHKEPYCKVMTIWN